MATADVLSDMTRLRGESVLVRSREGQLRLTFLSADDVLRAP